MARIVVPAVLLAGGAAAQSFDCAAAAAQGAFKPYNVSNGVITLTIIPYGATLTNLYAPDSTGTLRDVVLGFDNTTWYCAYGQHPYFGATIGRYSNRIANSSFQLDGVTFNTSMNEFYTGGGGDTLHGGIVGFDRHVWTVLSYDASSHITLQDVSPSGDMGFPGTVRTTVTHSVTASNDWLLDYTATSDADTPVALTNHAYFNLNAFAAETVLDHVFQADADTYVVVDSHLIPTGDIGSVANAFWLDFTSPKAVGKDIRNGTVAPEGGYDNALIFTGWTPRTPPVRVATLMSPLTGVRLTMHTDQPSVQIYSGNFLNGSIPRKASQGGPGAFYQHWSAFTLEAQHYPDSVHHDTWPTTILTAGDVYRQTTVYHFDTA